MFGHNTQQQLWNMVVERVGWWFGLIFQPQALGTTQTLSWPWKYRRMWGLCTSLNLMLGRNDVIQQDNDPKHGSKFITEWLKNKIKVLQWPCQSPDLSPTESLQRDLNRVVHKQTPASLIVKKSGATLRDWNYMKMISYCCQRWFYKLLNHDCRVLWKRSYDLTQL